VRSWFVRSVPGHTGNKGLMSKAFMLRLDHHSFSLPQWSVYKVGRADRSSSTDGWTQVDMARWPGMGDSSSIAICNEETIMRYVAGEICPEYVDKNGRSVDISRDQILRTKVKSSRAHTWPGPPHLQPQEREVSQIDSIPAAGSTVSAVLQCHPPLAVCGHGSFPACLSQFFAIPVIPRLPACL